MAAEEASMRKPTSIIRMMQPRRDSFNDDVEEEEEERREAEILAALEAPEPPAEEVVARMHRELLVALAMPDAKLEELTRTEPVEKKWALIKMNAQLLRDKTLKKAALRWGDDKKDLLKRIDAELLPNLGTIGELQRSLSQGDRKMLKGFAKDDGLSVVLRAMQRRLVSYPRSAIDTVVCREYLMCLKAVCNRSEGMDEFLNHPEAIDTIAFCLDFEWSSNACLVLEFLSVVTHYSDTGRKRCCESLLRMSRRRLEPPFYHLVQGMKKTAEGSVKVKAEIATFVNVMIQTSNELEIRNEIRSALLAFEYIRVIHQALHAEQTLKNGDAELASVLKKQVMTEDLLGIGESAPRPQLTRVPSTLQVAKQKEFQDFAEDGTTPIDPFYGNMCGNCIAVKNRDRTIQKFAGMMGSKSSKHRWYEIKNGRFSWYQEKPGPEAQPNGVLDAADFVAVNVTSDDSELLKLTSFGFEIVLQDRVMAIGTNSEEERIKWTTALQMSFNSAVIKKHNLNVDKTLKLTEKEVGDCLRRLETELQVFDMLWKQDRDKSMIDFTVEGGRRSVMDASSLQSSFSLLVSHAQDNGFEGTLQRVVLELLTLPMDPDFGRLAWNAVHTSVQDIQQMEHRHHPYEYGELEQLIVKRMTMEEQFKTVGELNSTIQNKDNKVRELQEQLQALRSSGSAGSSSVGGSGSGPSAALAAPASLPLPAPPALPSRRRSGASKDLQPPSEAPSDPRLEKYRKMLRMHIPRPAVEMKMQVDGLDPSLLDAPQLQGASTAPSSEAPSDPRLEKYRKMLRMHIPRPAVEMKMQADGLNPSLLDGSAPSLAMGHGSGSTEAASPAASGPPVCEDPRFKKYFKMLKMHLPKGAVAQKMAAEGLDSAVLDLDPNSPAPPSGGSGPASPLGAMLLGKAAARPKPPVKPQDDVLLQELGMQAKPVLIPGTKVKQVYWTKVPLTTIKDSIWQSLGPDVPLGGYQTVLEDAFAVKASAAAKGSPAKDAGGGKEKKEVSIIEPKRGQNVAIGLGRYRLTDEQFHAAFVSLDPALLTSDTVPKLVQLLPTGEEFATVSEYTGDVSLLGRTERFFRSVGKIPRLMERVGALDVAIAFDDEAGELEAKLAGLSKALQDVENAPSFREILRVVLSVGNYMNGGTVRGLAHGFDLQFLTKLTTIKTNNGTRKTLIHFVASIGESSAPGIVDALEGELGSAHDCTTVSLTQLIGDVRKLRSRVDKVQRELETGSGGSNQPAELSAPFRERIAPFVATSVARMDSLQAELDVADGAAKAIATMFAVKPSGGDDTAQKVLVTVSQFLRDIKQAKADNEKEEEEARKAEEEKNAAGASDGGDQQGGEKKKDLFKNFAASRAGDASSIIAELQMKMNNRKRAV